jgi:hypothetical protein
LVLWLQDDPVADQLTYLLGNKLRTGTIKSYLEDAYAFEHHLKWLAVALLVVFNLALRFTVALATKYLHFQKR